MAKPKRKPKSYDSSIERIAGYQTRRATWLEKYEKKFEINDEYNALTSLRNRIKNDISVQIEALSNYQKITAQGFLSKRDAPYSRAKRDETGEILKDENGNQVIGPLIEFPNMDNYHVLINKNEDVRNKLEIECQEFIEDVLPIEKIQSILSLIFSHSYKVQKNHEDYRLTVATLMLRQALWEIEKFLPSHTQFLKADLTRAREIAESTYSSKVDKSLP